MTNYRKFSSKEKPTAAEIEAEAVVENIEEIPAVEVVEKETVEETPKTENIEKETCRFGRVTAPLLNFRAAPKTDAKILDTIKNGFEVKIIKEIDGSDWYKIEYNGRTGFVMKTYIEKM